MKASKQYKENQSRTIQTATHKKQMARLEDNRIQSAKQAKMIVPIQRQDEEKDKELLQGKFEVMQSRSKNQTGIPDDLKQHMENSFDADFSSVKIHPNSPEAPKMGALAYTQGRDIHFAPGQFKPDTHSGQNLLGHELAHVIQQQEGRVQPTAEINGIEINDDTSLEKEADILGGQAAK